jgi:hypothetical protein
MAKDPFIRQADINALFELVLNGTCPMLSHEDQLVLGISLIYSRKPKYAERLHSLYSRILIHKTIKSVQRIALCIEIGEILEIQSNSTIEF